MSELYCPNCGRLVADDRPRAFTVPTMWERAECECSAVLMLAVAPDGRLVIKVTQAAELAAEPPLDALDLRALIDRNAHRIAVRVRVVGRMENLYLSELRALDPGLDESERQRLTARGIVPAMASEELVWPGEADNV